MTLSSNSKSGHWSVVAKANSGTLSTGLWNAIDTDAVDTDRSQAGTLPQLLALKSAGSRKGPTGCEQRSTCCTLPVIAILQAHFMFLLVLSESTLDPKNAVPDDMSSKHDSAV